MHSTVPGCVRLDVWDQLYLAAHPYCSLSLLYRQTPGLTLIIALLWKTLPSTSPPAIVEKKLFIYITT